MSSSEKRGNRTKKYVRSLWVLKCFNSKMLCPAKIFKKPRTFNKFLVEEWKERWCEKCTSPSFSRSYPGRLLQSPDSGQGRLVVCCGEDGDEETEPCFQGAPRRARRSALEQWESLVPTMLLTRTRCPSNKVHTHSSHNKPVRLVLFWTTFYERGNWSPEELKWPAQGKWTRNLSPESMFFIPTVTNCE